jgi:hypothetical protein
MADMKNPLLWSLSLGMVLCSEVGVCWAEEPGAQSAASEAESAPPKTVAPPKKPAPCPVYVSDPERLAALTASDPVVFEKADSLALRENDRRLLVPSGLLIGGGLILAGTLDRLSNDRWTDGSKWTVFSGVSVAAVTLLISWALAPERDDLLTVINHWNLRHPERPLAP